MNQGIANYSAATEKTTVTHRIALIVRELDVVDQAVYRAIAATNTPALDRGLRRLSRSADHSVLWLSIAAALAVKPGRGRRAAMSGVSSIGVASATTNILGKKLVNRRRPDQVGASVPANRHVRLPGSTSFPSGHAASAFAFASAVAIDLPALSLPLHLLATAVAYSRVHTGVHYPLDVMVGASVGIAAASIAGSVRAGT